MPDSFMGWAETGPNRNDHRLPSLSLQYRLTWHNCTAAASAHCPNASWQKSTSVTRCTAITNERREIFGNSTDSAKLLTRLKIQMFHIHYRPCQPFQQRKVLLFLGGGGAFSAHRAEFLLIVVINNKNNKNAVRELWLSHPCENVFSHHPSLGDPLRLYSLSCLGEWFSFIYPVCCFSSLVFCLQV
jgi:hypothetical protein